MLDVYSWIFIIVFGLTFLIAFVYNCIKVYISNKYFTKECIEAYEETIQKYNFSINDTVDEIVKKMGKEIQYKAMKKEAYIDKKAPHIVQVRSDLSERKKNFAVCHELGHSLRGFKYRAARDKNFLSRISPEEQICDYYAAAILLPVSDVRKKLEDVQYSNLSQEKKKDFIQDMANSKNIMEEVVFRRIDEINLMN